MSRRLIIWGGGILAVILLAIFVLAYFIDEPLRRRVEGEMNARSRGIPSALKNLISIRLGFRSTSKNCGSIRLLNLIRRSPIYRISTPAFIGKHFFLDDWLAIFN
jgi:hypothetical protein